MKYLAFVGSMLLPTLVFADTVESLATFEDNSGLLASLSIASTLIVAFVTIAMIWISARQMNGGFFGKVLYYFAAGMTFVFFSFATELPWFHTMNVLFLEMIHSSLFITGYILMGIAASKLLKVIKGE